MTHKEKKISQSFQRWLLLLVTLAFLLSIFSLWFLHTGLAQNSTVELLTLNLSDVRNDIIDASDDNMLALTKTIAHEVSALRGSVTHRTLLDMSREYDIWEINVIDENGSIIVSTNPGYLGYNMSGGKQSSEFLVLLDEQTSYVQSYQPTSFDATISRKYAGVSLPEGGFVQIGYDAEQFQQDINTAVLGVTRNRHVGESGCVIIADEDWQIVSDRYGNEGENLSVTGLWIDTQTMPQNKTFTATVYGESCYCMYSISEGYCAIAAMPKSEAVLSRNVSVALITGMEIFVFASLFIMIYVLINKLIVQNILTINSSLSKISAGNLEEVVDVRSHEEFSSLSDDINATVDTLKRYITEAEARIDAELEFAKAIQYSALPSVFPPYPQFTEFDIWAGMWAAKEVGGDFYDFYFVNPDTLAFVIADVSGKGIPAAMFMMRAKTLLKSCATSGLDPQEVFTQANEILCEGNDADMFVTAWMGFLNIRTGMLTFANAGHNPPLVQQADGSFVYLKSRPGFMLAGMEGIRYRRNQLQLQPGDTLFLYTDGVTEAIDEADEFYGDARLQQVLNRAYCPSTQALCSAVKTDLSDFVGNAAQFDDITMLALRYNGPRDTRELTLAATVENIAPVTAFVDELLEQLDCPMKAQAQIDIAIDELFGNIARYAYPERPGDVTVQFTTSNSPRKVMLTFIDDGIPYDPLSHTDPDTNLAAEDREIGGLGILLVKRSMDHVIYQHRNGKNILTIIKNL